MRGTGTTSRRRIHRRGSAALGATALALLLSASPARAAGTDPLLSLGGTRTLSNASGATAVEIQGSFAFEDRLQFPFPAGLIAFQGNRFVRYEVGGVVAEGIDPAVADGITAGEVPALLAAGTPAAAPAEILRLGPAEVAIALPPSLGPGPVSFLAYAVLEGTAFVSNSITGAIP